MSVRRETMKVVWFKQEMSDKATRNRFEGAVDIRQIKEVRPGKSSRDFIKWSEEPKSNSTKANRCLVVFYGTEFNLKTLSVVALSPDERDSWIKGLNYLVEDVRNSSYRIHQERWFRKGFYQMETPGKEGTMSIQDLKRFMQKVSLKISTANLKDKFNKYDTESTGEIGFDDFCSILQELLFQKPLFKEVLQNSELKRLTLMDFQKFLAEEQGEVRRNTMEIS